MQEQPCATWSLHRGDACGAYVEWPRPDLIVSDGAYGVGGFPGDPRTPDKLAEWYAPHVESWSKYALPATTLWFWNTEIGWATVHPLLAANSWEYAQTVVWDKGIGHIAGNVNGDTIRRFPVVTENPVQPGLVPGHEAAVARAFVTAAYNGIEPALKMLLLAPNEPAFTLDDLKMRPYGHDLDKLYAELASEDRDDIEMHFGEHWSLNEFEQLGLGFSTVQGFISHLNGGDTQAELLAWRYALLDELGMDALPKDTDRVLMAIKRSRWQVAFSLRYTPRRCISSAD